MSRTPRILSVLAMVGVALVAAAPRALASSVEVTASTREIYAGLPFTLSIQISGFDETPEPQASELKIEGCDVTYLGAQPNVQSMIQIFNGEKTESRTVTWVLRYRVTPRAKGLYQLPAIVVKQGAKQDQSRPAQFTAKEIAATTDMRIRLTLPGRPVWVGETFPVTLDWYLKKNVHDQTFVVPLFTRDDAVEVAAPPTDDRRAQRLSFAAGAKDIELPLERGQATLDNETYTRFRFNANVTAIKPGVLELEPARVVARLEVGEGRDAFGFPVARTELFKAEDKPLRLDVKPLPLDGRPASFRGAVGTSFTIEVKADRSVVRMGDPIKLEVIVRGHGRLEGLTLPPLDVEGGLPRELFSVPEDAPPGELLEDGGKRFQVTVRVRSDKAREIPRIPFSFFNPLTGSFETVRSQPIALAVEGSSVVGAESVVSTVRSSSNTSAPTSPGVRPTGEPVSLTGADLALSSPDSTLDRPLSVRDVMPAVVFFYVAPFVLLVAWKLHERTKGARTTSATIGAALERCLVAVDCAAGQTARAAASQIATALEALRREVGLGASEIDTLVQKCELAAFDPSMGSHPLDAALVADAKATVRRLAGDTAPKRSGRLPAILGAVVAGIGIVAVANVVFRASRRDDESPDRLLAIRQAYQDAMREPDRDRRVAAFGRAEASLGALAEAHPRCPELLCDWGAAALGAQDTGRAVLAFRRALSLDPAAVRARTNLAWLRERMASSVPEPQSSALDSLGGWAKSRSTAVRTLGSAIAFALAFALVGAGATRWRTSRSLAVLPVIVWLGIAVSLAVERDESRDAVVVQDGLLRAADSIGAPAVLSQPLPAGAEVVVKESRAGWAKVELATGTAGWVQESAIALVAARG